MEILNKILLLFTNGHNKIGNVDKFLQRQNAAGYIISLYFAASTYNSDKRKTALKAVEHECNYDCKNCKYYDNKRNVCEKNVGQY